MTNQKLKPIHPGDIIKTELLEANDLTARQLATSIGIKEQVITGLIAEKSSITPDLALRLSIYFSISPEFFLNLQQRYDLKLLRYQQEAHLRKVIHPHHSPHN